MPPGGFCSYSCLQNSHRSPYFPVHLLALVSIVCCCRHLFLLATYGHDFGDAGRCQPWFPRPSGAGCTAVFSTLPSCQTTKAAAAWRSRQQPGACALRYATPCRRRACRYQRLPRHARHCLLALRLPRACLGALYVASRRGALQLSPCVTTSSKRHFSATELASPRMPVHRHRVQLPIYRTVVRTRLLYFDYRAL